jgi:hypothetical protein
MSDENTVDLADWVERKEREKQRSPVIASNVTVDERHYERLTRAQIMLAVLVREHGRVRLSARDLAAVTRKDKLDVKVQDNGDVIVSFVQG